MTALTIALLTFVGVPADRRQSMAEGLFAAAGRYILSALGPVSISAAHFAAAVILLRELPRTEFGLFAFLLVVAPFCLSVCGALFAPPIAREAARPGGIAEAARLSLFKSSVVFSAAAAAIVTVAMIVSGAAAPLAAIFGLYGGAMTLRWFARCWTYAERRVARVLASDLTYSLLLTAGLVGLVSLHEITMWRASVTLLVAATAAVMAFDLRHLRVYVRALCYGRLTQYLAFWRDLSRWALVGVALSEATANAHSYLVTFIAGPHAFAMIAAGSLLMRPVSLVLSALPDVERPLMSYALRAEDRPRAFRIVSEFRTAAGAIWFATLILAGVLLTWFPRLVLKNDYPLGQVTVVVAIYALAMASRTLRTPDAVLLQAAGEFRKLAGVGVWSSIASLSATCALLFMVGPVAALGGVLIGELVATERTFAFSRAWKRSHD